MNSGIEENKKLLISIDYDNTFTSCPQTWLAVINLLRKCGCDVICCSARHECEGNRRELEKAIPNTVILLTSAQQKKSYANKNGYNPDIWIDDIPASIPTPDDVDCWKFIIEEYRTLDEN